MGGASAIFTRAVEVNRLRRLNLANGPKKAAPWQVRLVEKLRPKLFLRLLGLDFVQAGFDAAHLFDEILRNLILVALFHDVEMGDILHDVGGQRKQPRDQALILERADVERGDSWESASES